MEQVTKYQRYAYNPRRGGHNLYTPEELAAIIEADANLSKLSIDELLSGMTQRKRMSEEERLRRKRQNDKDRYERLKAARQNGVPYEKKRRGRKRMDADAPERGREDLHG